MDRRKKPLWQKRIANERIKILFEKAEEESFKGNYDLSKRYVELARRIANKFNIKLSCLYGKKFCRKCNTYFTSDTLQVRLNKKNKTIEYICKCCGYVRRYPYKLRSSTKFGK